MVENTDKYQIFEAAYKKNMEHFKANAPVKVQEFLGYKVVQDPAYFSKIFVESFHEADADKDSKLNSEEFKNYRKISYKKFCDDAGVEYDSAEDEEIQGQVFLASQGDESGFVTLEDLKRTLDWQARSNGMNPKYMDISQEFRDFVKKEYEEFLTFPKAYQEFVASKSKDMSFFMTIGKEELTKIEADQEGSFNKEQFISFSKACHVRYVAECGCESFDRSQEMYEALFAIHQLTKKDFVNRDDMVKVMVMRKKVYAEYSQASKPTQQYIEFFKKLVTEFEASPEQFQKFINGMNQAEKDAYYQKVGGIYFEQADADKDGAFNKTEFMEFFRLFHVHLSKDASSSAWQPSADLMDEMFEVYQTSQPGSGLVYPHDMHIVGTWEKQAIKYTVGEPTQAFRDYFSLVSARFSEVSQELQNHLMTSNDDYYGKVARQAWAESELDKDDKLNEKEFLDYTDHTFKAYKKDSGCSDEEYQTKEITLAQFAASQVEAPGSGFVTGKDLYVTGLWIKLLIDEQQNQH